MSKGKIAETGRDERLIAMAQMREIFGGCSFMTIERQLEKDPTFPKPITLPGGTKRFWSAREVHDWIGERLVKRDGARGRAARAA